MAKISLFERSTGRILFTDSANNNSFTSALKKAIDSGVCLKGLFISNQTIKDLDVNGCVLDEWLIEDSVFENCKLSNVESCTCLLNNCLFYSSNLNNIIDTGMVIKNTLIINCEVRRMVSNKLMVTSSKFVDSCIRNSKTVGLYINHCSTHDSKQSNNIVTFARIKNTDMSGLKQLESSDYKGLCRRSNPHEIKHV